jgi:hypothetical protein
MFIKLKFEFKFVLIKLLLIQIYKIMKNRTMTPTMPANDAHKDIPGNPSTSKVARQN